jgi:L-ascorbate metabolism protein UlaG (beta-lactamase superfamily)
MKSAPQGFTSSRKDRVHHSPHYKNGAFQNEEPTTVMLKGHFFHTLNEFIHKPKTTIPPKPLPTVKSNLQNLRDDKPCIIWFGHSSYLVKYKGFTILVDPLIQSHASPVAFFGKPFPGTDIFQVNDFPEIDLLILTHDHYDHLSFHVIKALEKKVKAICTSLGVGGILESWGVHTKKIIELDWNENFSFTNNVKLTAQTARHFSGRTLRRNQTIWSAFVLEFYQYKIFIGGDSGYGKHFKQIGKKFGPFDMAFLECGQYGDNWPLIHMRPEETVQAAIDIQAKFLMPVHWAKFTLSVHPWSEPPERLLASPLAHQLTITTPKIGEPFWLGEKLPQEKWWKDM